MSKKGWKNRMKKQSIKISDFKVNPLNIMKQLGDLVDEYKHHDDSDFWYDRNYFIKQKFTQFK